MACGYGIIGQKDCTCAILEFANMRVFAEWLIPGYSSLQGTLRDKMMDDKLMFIQQLWKTFVTASLYIPIKS